jgi:hypothetical protein
MYPSVEWSRRGLCQDSISAGLSSAETGFVGSLFSLEGDFQCAGLAQPFDLGRREIAERFYGVGCR